MQKNPTQNLYSLQIYCRRILRKIFIFFKFSAEESYAKPLYFSNLVQKNPKQYLFSCKILPTNPFSPSLLKINIIIFRNMLKSFRSKTKIRAKSMFQKFYSQTGKLIFKNYSEKKVHRNKIIVRLTITISRTLFEKC